MNPQTKLQMHIQRLQAIAKELEEIASSTVEEAQAVADAQLEQEQWRRDMEEFLGRFKRPHKLSGGHIPGGSSKRLLTVLNTGRAPKVDGHPTSEATIEIPSCCLRRCSQQNPSMAL